VLRTRRSGTALACRLCTQPHIRARSGGACSVEGLKEWGALLLSLGAVMMAWFRYDDGIKRIAKLELISVTHEQLERSLSKLAAERAAMHVENTDWLRRIEKKIDDNDERADRSCDDLQKEVHNLALELAKRRS
jgi:hypothetical protein